MAKTESTHLAIGEVLALLHEDFPDVTISKIRFLESQGLINPERTSAGYRRFYENDIHRLQWVLRQQKERFLPLKVIKAKLDAGEDRDDGAAQPSLFGEAEPPPEPIEPTDLRSRDPQATEPSATEPLSAATAVAPHTSAATPIAPAAGAPSPSVSPSSSSSDERMLPPGSAAQHHPASGGARSGDDPLAWLAALQEAPKSRRPASRPLDGPLDLTATVSDSTYTEAELVAETGIAPEALRQLIDFGLVPARQVAGEAAFDESALEVVRTAAVFVSKGIEARHLRAYKLAAEREVALFEQLTLPLLRQRNPQSRVQAAEALAGLTASGGELRHALLRQALQNHVRQR